MLDGASRIGEVVAAAAADGQPAVGITDHGNMYGVLPLYEAAREAGVKPVLGMEGYFTNTSRFERPKRSEHEIFHLTMLAETNEGYANLIKISSAAYLADINKTAASYYSNEFSHLSDADMLRDYWTDVRRIVIPYDRGAMYFAVLDDKITQASRGKRSVDDLVRVVVDRNRHGITTDEAFWVGLLRRELGKEGETILAGNTGKLLKEPARAA